AKRSPISEIQEDRKEMERLWMSQRTTVESRNIIAAARDSSSLQIAVGKKQLNEAFSELQQQNQQQQSEGQVDYQGKSTTTLLDGELSSDTTDSNYAPSGESSARSSRSTINFQYRNSLCGPSEIPCQLRTNTAPTSTATSESSPTCSASEYLFIGETGRIEHNVSPSVRKLDSINEHKKKRQRLKDGDSSLLLSSKSSTPPKTFYLDPSTFTPMTYSIGADNIGYAFHGLQLYGVLLANDTTVKATMANLQCFFLDEGEDSFVHKALHAMISTVFGDFKKKWANKSAEGSKERRKENDKEGLRPDLQVTINNQTVLFMEVKPPSCAAEMTYLADRWKLANLAKDELDASLRKHIRLPFVTIIQVFGHKMEIHTVSLQNGLYHFHQQFQVYVPRARDDAGSARACLQALFSVKSWLQGLRLPPVFELAQSRPRPAELDDVKKSRITPTTRRMF
ncbi:hypothetical protein BGX27_003784, partial [Mortierella sp. AM989]